MNTCFVDFVKAHDRVPSDKLWAPCTFVECNVRRLMFAVDLALLSSNENDLQYALY